MNATEQALVLLWKIAGNTPQGCVALMQTLTAMMDDEDHDREMVMYAHELAFMQCQAMQLKEGQKAWAGDLCQK